MSQENHPYTQGDGDSYTFPIEEFPTRESVVEYFRWTEGESFEKSPWMTLEDVEGPMSNVRIHDHDEDYSCPGDTDACPLAKRIDAWWVAG